MGVITNIGDAHIEKLGSRGEPSSRPSASCWPHIRKGNGLLILNADDEMLVTLRGNTPVKPVFCGKGEGAEYRAQVTGGDGVSHIHCHLTTPAMDREVKIPALGEHMIYPTLIAAAVGGALRTHRLRDREGDFPLCTHPHAHEPVQRGENITILDDTYNAKPPVHAGGHPGALRQPQQL